MWFCKKLRKAVKTQNFLRGGLLFFAELTLSSDRFILFVICAKFLFLWWRKPFIHAKLILKNVKGFEWHYKQAGHHANQIWNRKWRLHLPQNARVIIIHWLDYGSLLLAITSSVSSQCWWNLGYYNQYGNNILYPMIDVLCAFKPWEVTLLPLGQWKLQWKL